MAKRASLAPKEPSPPRVRIRSLLVSRGADSDFAAALQIEESLVDSLTSAELTTYLREKHLVGKVIEFNDIIAGYMLYRFNADEYELVRMVIRPAWRGLGLGQRLVEYLVERLVATKRRRMVMLVRDSALPMHQYLRRLGFRAVRVTRNWYSEPVADAYEFEYRAEGTQ